jgi:pimeloyl-ACP methyl ester carboxylesterase
MGIQVITIDRPGYGESTRKHGRRIVDTAYDLEQLVDALQLERVGLYARSGGVQHALAFAAMCPDRTFGLAGMSGLAPKHINPQWSKMSPDNLAKHEYALRDPGRVIADMERLAQQVKYDKAAIYNMFFHDLKDPDKSFLERGGLMWHWVTESHREGMKHDAGGWVDDTLASNDPSGWPRGFDLGNIACPSIFWHGGQDPFADISNSLTLQQAVPNSAAIVHESQGHFGGLAYTAEALGYLAGRHALLQSTGHHVQTPYSDLKEAFAIRERYESPIYPMVVMRDLEQPALS